MLSKPAAAETKRRRRDDAEVRREVERFFDWAGYCNYAKRREWGDWAAAELGRGHTRSEILAHLKASWISHCRAAGTLIRRPHTDPQLAAFLFGIIQEQLGSNPPLVPKQVAVLWRAAARDFPGNDWVSQVAAKLDAMDDWSQWTEREDADIVYAPYFPHSGDAEPRSSADD